MRFHNLVNFTSLASTFFGIVILIFESFAFGIQLASNYQEKWYWHTKIVDLGRYIENNIH